LPENPVLMDREGAVMVLTLNRPERMNAWTEDLEDLYFDYLDQAESDPTVRAVVVTGSGRAFCAGADFGDLEQLTAGVPAGISGKRPRARAYYLDKPLIAALNGATAGLGLVQALYCDVRFCSEEAKITTAFARRGLIGEYGIAWLLPRLVGPGRARDLLLSSRVIDGREAAAIGLIEHVSVAGTTVVDALAYADDLARNCSPASMAVMKAQLRDSYRVGFEDAVGEAERLLHESLERPDLAEGVASFLERREPNFDPLHPSSSP
jgi:enoyl-CoA hydratase/carnithine racemase